MFRRSLWITAGEREKKTKKRRRRKKGEEAWTTSIDGRVWFRLLRRCVPDRPTGRIVYCSTRSRMCTREAGPCSRSGARLRHRECLQKQKETAWEERRKRRTLEFLRLLLLFYFIFYFIWTPLSYSSNNSYFVKLKLIINGYKEAPDFRLKKLHINYFLFQDI